LEEAGLSTLVLTPTYEFHRAVGIPRSAAIEYPYGRPVGQVGDKKGQRKVLLMVLSVFEKAKNQERSGIFRSRGLKNLSMPIGSPLKCLR
jgi:hypothetical protein